MTREEQKRNLEAALRHLGALQKVARASGQLAAGATSAIAWQVGVVAPGFLGLLWNGEALRNASRLTTGYFNVVYLVGELSFLCAIALATIGYNYFARLSIVTAGFGPMHEAYVDLASTTASDVDLSKQIDGTRRQVAEALKSLGEVYPTSMPWYVSHSLDAFQWFAYGGYGCAAIILLSLWFE